MKIKDNLIILAILIIYIASACASYILVKNLNLFFFMQVIIILLVIGVYLYINETRLFYILFWGVILSNWLGERISIFSNYIYIALILMIIKLFEKKFIRKEKIIFDYIIILLSFILLIINVISLIYNGYSLDIKLILFYTLKRYSFIIFFLYFRNINLQEKTIKHNFKLMYLFVILQTPIIIFQFITGIEQDNITGLFGVKSTSILLQYLLYLLTFYTLFNKNNKNIFRELTFVILILLYCAIAEVKIGFFVVPIIYLLILLLRKNLVKVFICSVVIILSFSGIYTVFINIYPEHDFLNNKSFINSYLNEAYVGGSINRSGFMPQLEKNVIDNSFKKYFGNGLATVNPSKISWLEGPVMRQNRSLNLHFFTLPYSIAESGIIGTSIYILIYIYIILRGIYSYIKSSNKNSIFTIIIGIILLIFITYNNAIITSNLLIMQTWFLIVIMEYKKFNFNNGG